MKHRRSMSWYDKKELKGLEHAQEYGYQIQYLMRRLEAKNIEIKFLRKKLWDIEHSPPIKEVDMVGWNLGK